LWSFQFVIAITLVCGVLVINRQLTYMQEKDLGFDATAKIVVPLRTEDAGAHYETLRHELLGTASIAAVSAADYVPGSRIYSDARLYMEGKTIEDAVTMVYNSVDAGYIEQLGIKLIAGRSFTDNRTMEGGRKLILNRTAVKSYNMDPQMNHRQTNTICKPQRS
jgi:putative ABC transport system permease protein